MWQQCGLQELMKELFTVVVDNKMRFFFTAVAVGPLKIK